MLTLLGRGSWLFCLSLVCGLCTVRHGLFALPLGSIGGSQQTHNVETTSIQSTLFQRCESPERLLSVMVIRSLYYCSYLNFIIYIYANVLVHGDFGLSSKGKHYVLT